MEERSQTMLCKKSRFRVKSNSLLHKSVVVALLIAVCGVGSVNAAQVMKVGGARDVPPVYFKDAQSVLIGFDVDVLREIGKRIGKNMEFQGIDWSEKSVLLNSGKIDIIASALNITDERKTSYSLTRPIIDNGYVAIVRADSSIRELDELSAKTVCILNGVYYIPELMKFKGRSGPPATVITGTNEFCLTEMLKGKMDATVIKLLAANYYMKFNPGSFRVLPGKLTTDQTTFALRKNDAALRDQFDKAIAEMESDGTMAELRDRWFNQKE